MDLNLNGKAIVVVGASWGIGSAVAEVLAEAGVRLAIISRDKERIESRAAALSTKGTEVIGLAADGTVPGSVEGAIDQAAEHFGSLDGLAVTAGPGCGHASFLERSEEEWEQQFQAIFMMTVRSCRAAIPHMQRAGGGQIVLTASYSTRASKPSLLPYVAMKSAVASLSKNLAVAHGPDNIRVNCVCPGAVATEALDKYKERASAIYGGDPDAALARYARDEWRLQPSLGRIGQPRELAELYGMLLSPRASYTTGAIINSDGGTDFF